MAIKPLVYYPSPILRQVAPPVRSVDARVRRLATALADTMRSANGIGLAAPQVGVLERVIVISSSDGVLTLVNPEIVSSSGQQEDGEEGCLSIPGVFGTVRRDRQIAVRALNLGGASMQFTAEGMFARVVQHEVDHLNGVLIVDRFVRFTAGRDRMVQLWAAETIASAKLPATPQATARRR